MPSMYEISSPAKIGDNLEVDVVVNRTTTLSSRVTEYPVEDGFPIADHVTRQPKQLSLTVVFTPTPVTWNDSKANPNRMAEVARELENIYQKAEPITVTLTDAIYENMIMLSAPLPRNVEDGYCYKMQIDFQQVRIVNQKTEALTSSEAAEKAGETEKDAGTAQQSDIGTGTTSTTTTAAHEEVPTMTADTANAGSVSTGKELTANAAVVALISSL